MRIDLQITTAFRPLLVVATAGALLMTVFSIVDVGLLIVSPEAIPHGVFGLGPSTRIPILLLCGLFSGLASLVFIRRLTLPQGVIEVRPDGVFICCYSIGPNSGIFGGYKAVGVADWPNLSATGLVRAQFRPCLGIRFRDPGVFAASKAKLNEQERSQIDHFGHQSVRIFYALGPKVPVVGSLSDLMMTLFGFTGMPKSAEEKDIWTWNEENYGWHLLIPDVILPTGPEAVRRAIEQHRPTV